MRALEFVFLVFVFNLPSLNHFYQRYILTLA